MHSNLALVALGSNQTSDWGNPAACLTRALAQIQPLASGDLRISRFYRTPAFPAGAGPDFINAAVAFDCTMTATDLLAALHQIEAAAGRLRTIRWGQRVLDLDLIALGAQICPNAATQAHWRNLAPHAQANSAPQNLILPHPRLQDRGFVLIPLADIAPDWRHPLRDTTVAQMAAALPDSDRASIVPIPA